MNDITPKEVAEFMMMQLQKRSICIKEDVVYQIEEIWSCFLYDNENSNPTIEKKARRIPQVVWRAGRLGAEEVLEYREKYDPAIRPGRITRR